MRGLRAERLLHARRGSPARGARRDHRRDARLGGHLRQARAPRGRLVLLSRIRAFFTGRGYPSSGPVPKELLELRGLVERLAREAPFHWWDVEPATLPSGAQILSLPPEEQVASALLAVELLPTQAYQGRYVLERLLSELLRRKLPFPDEQLT